MQKIFKMERLKCLSSSSRSTTDEVNEGIVGGLLDK